MRAGSCANAACRSLCRHEWPLLQLGQCPEKPADRFVRRALLVMCRNGLKMFSNDQPEFFSELFSFRARHPLMFYCDDEIGAGSRLQRYIFLFPAAALVFR